MSEVSIHNRNLNIWYYLPEEVWMKVNEIYKEMPGWLGFSEGIPYWFGYDDDPVTISASVEPSGLQFFAQMNGQYWENWFNLLKYKATEVLGFEVGEPEDGYE